MKYFLLYSSYNNLWSSEVKKPFWPTYISLQCNAFSAKSLLWNVERDCIQHLRVYGSIGLQIFPITNNSSRECCKKKWTGQKLGYLKKTTISIQLLWNLLKMTNSWVGKIAWILALLCKNCGFFINSLIFGQSTLFCNNL